MYNLINKVTQIKSLSNLDLLTKPARIKKKFKQIAAGLRETRHVDTVGGCGHRLVQAPQKMSGTCPWRSLSAQGEGSALTGLLPPPDPPAYGRAHPALRAHPSATSGQGSQQGRAPPWGTILPTRWLSRNGGGRSWSALRDGETLSSCLRTRDASFPGPSLPSRGL